MYAIAFDLDTKIQQESYPSPSWQNAYADIGRFLRSQGFDRQQGSVYFGDDTVDVVRCQIAAQELTLKFDWFAPSVRDIRMLRIDDDNDLLPAVELALRMKKKLQPLIPAKAGIHSHRPLGPWVPACAGMSAFFGGRHALPEHHNSDAESRDPGTLRTPEGNGPVPAALEFLEAARRHCER